MFNGFPSTQTPTVQWWDYSKSNTGTINIALPNDCAPVQFFATGASATSIQVTLPPNPAQGKTITFKNERYRSFAQSIQINDPFPQASSGSCVLGQGGSVTFCYIAQNTLTGLKSANWVIISGGSGFAPLNFYAASLSGYENNATGDYSVIAGGSTNTASGSKSSIIGGLANTSSSTNSAIIGGQANTASQQSASVVGGQNNSVSGQSATVVGGEFNGSTASYSAIVGGNSNSATGQDSIVAGGYDNGASGIDSGVFTGYFNFAISNNSVVVGGARGITRSIIGNNISPACNVPIANSNGISQSSLLILGVQTTDATATRLRSNTSAAGTTNQVILPDNSAYVFQGTCIANVTGGGTTSGWKFEGVIKRGAGVGTTALVAAVTPIVIAQDVAAATWVLAITADVTNGGIAVTVTGAAATTIRWVSTIESTEVTF
jgi:hypothetical protein